MAKRRSRNLCLAFSDGLSGNCVIFNMGSVVWVPCRTSLCHALHRVCTFLRSNTGMSQTNPMEERLTELEIKSSFQEDLLDKLDQIITRQQTQIDALTREIIAMRQQAPQAGDAPQRNLLDDLPPHY
jgi:SlyX protein